MSNQTLVERFRRARSDQSMAVLEGFHPLKHAIRFGADLIDVFSVSPEELVGLAESNAPDVVCSINRCVRAVSRDVFEQLAPVPPPTGVIAIARRPEVSLTEMLNDPAPAPLVLLENPRNLLNIGAAVRVAAAAEAAGVVTTGARDPWHPAALIAATGLHYAIPVAQSPALPICERPLVVLDPDGEPIQPGSIPAGAILAFGAEREGLSRELMASARHRVSIPMRPGVSSLNLATAIAVVLYAWKLGA